jgi:hypothetical protein
MPVGGPGGGPLSVTLTQAQLDSMSEGLFRRARLPLDQACWQAGVDLNEVLVEYQKTKERMARKGVPAWKQEMVGGGGMSRGSVGGWVGGWGGCVRLEAGLVGDGCWMLWGLMCI